jgi:hypothetical protein
LNTEDTNVHDLFQKEDEDNEFVHNYIYTVTLTDGTQQTAEGYLYVQGDFLAILRGKKGVLYDYWRFDTVAKVHNEGPANQGTVN